MGRVRVLRQSRRFFLGPAAAPAVSGLPVAFALTGAKADEREALLDLLAAEPRLIAARPAQTLIGDKNYFGRGFEDELAEQDIRLLRPARQGEPQRPGALLSKPLRQVAESVNETFKGQTDLEQHRGARPAVSSPESCSASCHSATIFTSTSQAPGRPCPHGKPRLRDGTP